MIEHALKRKSMRNNQRVFTRTKLENQTTKVFDLHFEHGNKQNLSEEIKII